MFVLACIFAWDIEELRGKLRCVVIYRDVHICWVETWIGRILHVCVWEWLFLLSGDEVLSLSLTLTDTYTLYMQMKTRRCSAVYCHSFTQWSVASVNIRRHSSLLRRWFMWVLYSLIALCMCVCVCACVQPQGRAAWHLQEASKCSALPVFITPHPLSSARSWAFVMEASDLQLCLKQAAFMWRQIIEALPLVILCMCSLPQWMFCCCLVPKRDTQVYK